MHDTPVALEACNAIHILALDSRHSGSDISSLAMYKGLSSQHMHATEVQDSTFSHTPLVFPCRIRDHKMLRSGITSACRYPRHQHILSYNDFHCYCTVCNHNPSTLPTDRQTSSNNLSVQWRVMSDILLVCITKGIQLYT